MTVHSLRGRTLLVIPIRLGLGVVWLVAARLAGASSGPALVAFALGAAGLTFLAFNDPRSRLARGEVDPLPLPADAAAAPWWRQAFAAMLPSTVGVSILAAIALAVDPTLAALLGGVCAGLGVAALLMLPLHSRRSAHRAADEGRLPRVAVRAKSVAASIPLVAGEAPSPRFHRFTVDLGVPDSRPGAGIPPSGQSGATRVARRGA